MGGPYWPRLEPYYTDERIRLASGAEAHLIHDVEMVGTSIGEHFGAVGAASLVLDQAFSASPSAIVASRRENTPRARVRVRA